MSTSQVSTTLRGDAVDEPEMPSGQLVLQPPPQIQPNEGAAGVAMNAIPMLGSLGSIVLVATLGSTGGGSGISSSTRFIAAGMFLFATLGFIFVQIDRQRKQRQQQVSGSRTEYLRYLSTVRKVARDAADQQRRALTWHHPVADGAARAGGGPHAGVGAQPDRPALPARALRALRPAAGPRAGAAGERTDRRRRPRGRLRAAPAPGRAPAAARPARLASTCGPSTGSRCAATRSGPGRWPGR